MTAMLKLAKLFLKEKMRKKLVQCTHEELFSVHGFVKEHMPPMAGGTHVESYVDWIHAGLARRQESCKLVRIDGADDAPAKKAAAKPTKVVAL